MSVVEIEKVIESNLLFFALYRCIKELLLRTHFALDFFFSFFSVIRFSFGASLAHLRPSSIFELEWQYCDPCNDASR